MSNHEPIKPSEIVPLASVLPPKGPKLPRGDKDKTYLPRADFFLWFIPVITRLLLITATAPIVLTILNFLGLIDGFIIPLAKVYLIQFKYFLKEAPPSNFVWLVDLLNKTAIYAFIVLGSAVAYATVKILNLPDQIEISDEGLHISRKVRMEDGSTARSTVGYVNFAEVSRVEIRRPRSTRSNLDYQFAFIGASGGEFVLRFGDVLKAEDRELLIDTLERKFPNSVDKESLEPFTRSNEKESYTALWLKELAASPKRDKLTPLEVNSTLNNGRYTILNRIGMGGQGTVYLANDNRPKNSDCSDVVLKEFLLPVFPDTRVRKAAAIRFQEEAALLGKLSHPQIVKFHELFLEDHRAYLVLEKLEGRTLKDMIDEFGPMKETQVTELIEQMCAILAYLHNQTPPVVHRDFTPDNLILHEDGSLRLIDFSVAQAVASNVTGSVVGKPHYISPEQFRGKATNQSDIYSMGATVFFLLTGQQPEPISNLKVKAMLPQVNNKLELIVEKCTKLDCAHRYHRVEEILRDLA
jgi:Protein kinase domain